MSELTTAITAATEEASSVHDLGQGLVHAITGQIPFDRFNIGLIDMAAYQFDDAFVVGQNVSGRRTGHLRPLDGSVVEAAIQNGDGFYFGHTDRRLWLERFPRFGPVLDSGIQAMLAVPVRRDDTVVASLVFASADPAAYNDDILATAISIGRTVTPALVGLLDAPGTTLD